MIVPMFFVRNTQLPKHFPSNFWCSRWIIKSGI